MLLREYLTEYTKEELLDQARSFEIRKCSGLRKADLIDRIVDNFCTEEMLRSRLACLTKEQMDLFRKACISPTDVSVNEVVDAMQLYRYWIGYFEEPTDRFCVFEDVAVAFSQIDDEAFRLKQCRKGWMVKCIDFFIQYYGIAPIEVIYEMYRQKVKCSIDEMIEMLWEMPVDIVESCLFTMDRLGMKEWSKENRGYKPSEMARKRPINKMPTIVPASSKAAAILKDATPQLQAKGMLVDLNGNADVIQTTIFPRGLNEEPIRVEKKIYPNDPCPCGSGKKYKKCCGKKN